MRLKIVLCLSLLCTTVDFGALCAHVLAAFLLVVRPVNQAFAAWTPQTLPMDWPRYRLQWELGHAGRAVLGAISLASLIRTAGSLATKISRC